MILWFQNKYCEGYKTNKSNMSIDNIFQKGSKYERRRCGRGAECAGFMPRSHQMEDEGFRQAPSPNRSFFSSIPSPSIFPSLTLNVNEKAGSFVLLIVFFWIRLIAMMINSCCFHDLSREFQDLRFWVSLIGDCLNSCFCFDSVIYHMMFYKLNAGQTLDEAITSSLRCTKDLLMNLKSPLDQFQVILVCKAGKSRIQPSWGSNYKSSIFSYN